MKLKRNEHCRLIPQLEKEMNVPQLTKDDGTYAGQLLSMLRNSPHPTSDPMWLVIESWAELMVKRIAAIGESE